MSEQQFKAPKQDLGTQHWSMWRGAHCGAEGGQCDMGINKDSPSRTSESSVGTDKHGPHAMSRLLNARYGRSAASCLINALWGQRARDLIPGHSFILFKGAHLCSEDRRKEQKHRGTKGEDKGITPRSVFGTYR